jgi:hypothetical protein
MKKPKTRTPIWANGIEIQARADRVGARIKGVLNGQLQPVILTALAQVSVLAVDEMVGENHAADIQHAFEKVIDVLILDSFQRLNKQEQQAVLEQKQEVKS